MNGTAIVGIVAGLLATWATVIVVLWLVRPRDVAARELVRVIPDVVRLVRDLIRDPRAPRGVRFALVGLLVWLINPIDLIPEVIPVIGPLDDVIVAVVVLRYVQRRLGRAELLRRWRGSDDGFALLIRVLGSA